MKIFLSTAFLACFIYLGQMGTLEDITLTPIRQQQLNLKEISEYLAGSQLVFFTKTSIFLEPSTRASSITYVNFCSDGRFTINHDGSYSIVNKDGTYAKGGKWGAYFGEWEVTEFNSLPYLKMAYDNETSDYYPIDVSKLIAGSWREGQTQYAIERNAVSCN